VLSQSQEFGFNLQLLVPTRNVKIPPLQLISAGTIVAQAPPDVRTEIIFKDHLVSSVRRPIGIYEALGMLYAISGEEDMSASTMKHLKQTPIVEHDLDQDNFPTGPKEHYNVNIYWSRRLSEVR
jgi:hypothetical protein